MDYLTIALILMTIGVGLLLAEILLPTGGILVVISLVLFAFAVGTIMYYGTMIEAVVALSGLAVGLPASGFVAVAAWRRISLNSPLDDAPTEAQVAAANELEALKGRNGRTVSPLRPSGSVEFDNKRIDAMTEGMMLDAGVWVRCVDVKGGKVIVRQMESPPDVTDIERPDDAPTPPAPKAPEPTSEQPKQDERKRPRDDFDDFDIGLDKI